MKISIINPPFDIITQAYGSTRKKAKYGYWAPFGIALLGSIVKQMGYQLEYIDAPVLDYGAEEVVKHLEKSKPDLIGVSAMLATRSQTYSLIKAIRERINDTPIFLGGTLGSIFPETVLKDNTGLNFVFVGEAENTIREVLPKLEKGESLKDVKGVYYRENLRIIGNESRRIVTNLDELPSPDWSIFDLSLYKPLPLNYKKTPIIPYLTSRGCSYARCTFCFESGAAAPKYRRHSPERVVGDIKEAVEKYGVKEIGFWDDIFVVNQGWVLKFCELLKKEKLDIVWHGYAYAGCATKKMIEAVADAGCWSLFIGLESGNQRVLDSIKKGVSVETMKKVVKWIHNAGIDTRGSFVVALPEDTPAATMESVKFAIQSDLTFAQFLPFFPEYGTELYSDLAKNGKIVDVYKGRTTAQYVPKGYKDEKEVENTVKAAYRRFYFRPAYFLKHIKRIKSVSDIKQYYEAFRFITGIGFGI